VNVSLTTLTLVLRILTAVEALALSAVAICTIDRQWGYATFAAAVLVTIYLVADRSLERRASEIRVQIAADEG
jgi:hypothetical protein